jgi:hypothetical protein
MNKFLKALIIGLIIFLVHFFVFAIMEYLKYTNFGFYGLLGGVIYGFIFGFWAYYVLTIAYLYLTKTILATTMKFIYALLIVIIGYFMSRTGDIIDGDFVRKFDFFLLLTFLLSSILLVVLDRLFSVRSKLT